MTKDQVTNIEHKIAFGLGTAIVTYVQTQPANQLTMVLTALGGALIAWSGLKSHQLNSSDTNTTTTPK